MSTCSDESSTVRSPRVGEGAQRGKVLSSENPSESDASATSKLSPGLSRGAGTPSICRNTLRQRTATKAMPS